MKLIDFGLARIIVPGDVVKAIMGTPEFVGKYFKKVYIFKFLLEIR